MTARAVLPSILPWSEIFGSANAKQILPPCWIPDSFIKNLSILYGFYLKYNMYAIWRVYDRILLSRFNTTRSEHEAITIR
jgi:hypothetical protein